MWFSQVFPVLVDTLSQGALKPFSDFRDSIHFNEASSKSDASVATAVAALAVV